jgi:hypothetical protein
VVERYEELRGVALGTTAPVHGRGLALILRRGMVAWMQAWSECAPAASTRVQPRVPRAEAIPRPEVVALLTEMAISAASEVRV